MSTMLMSAKHKSAIVGGVFPYFSEEQFVCSTFGDIKKESRSLTD